MSSINDQYREMAADLEENYLPHLSVNGAIFGIPESGSPKPDLHVLLLRTFPDAPWGLPHGYVHRDLSLDDAAFQTFSAFTGVSSLPLFQIGAFGAPDRITARNFIEYFSRKTGISPDHWMFGRVVSIAYTSLVPIANTSVTPFNENHEYQWAALTDLPELMLDHAEMVSRALGFLRRNINRLPLGDMFEGGEFTMPQLQSLHEVVHGQSLDRRNFQKQMLDMDLVDRQEGKVTRGAGRPAYLYRWKGRKEG